MLITTANGKLHSQVIFHPSCFSPLINTPFLSICTSSSLFLSFTWIPSQPMRTSLPSLSFTCTPFNPIFTYSPLSSADSSLVDSSSVDSSLAGSFPVDSSLVGSFSVDSSLVGSSLVDYYLVGSFPTGSSSVDFSSSSFI